MTIEQTVEIPADRRIFLDVPVEMPTGRASVTITVFGIMPAREASVSAPFPDLETLKENARRKTAAREASGIDPWVECRKSLAGGQLFGVDALEYQKKMRDEWS